MESDCVLRHKSNGSLVQLVDDESRYSNSKYITKEQYVFFREERPGMILDSYEQGNVKYYKIMLAYTGDVLVGVPESLLKDNELVL